MKSGVSIITLMKLQKIKIPKDGKIKLQGNENKSTVHICTI